MIHRLMTTLTLALVLGPLLRADELHLKDGRVFEGKVVSRTDRELVFRTRTSEITFELSRVDHVVPKTTVFDAYAERTARPLSVPEREVLAQWCKDQRLTREWRTELDKILAVDPDNAFVHDERGEVRVEGRWLPRDQAMPKLGYVKRAGKWVTTAEARKIDAADAEKKRLAALQRRLNDLVSALFDESQAASDAALVRLFDIAKKEDIAGLDDVVRALHSAARRVRTGADVLTEVRLQDTKLLGIEKRQVSLASGTPVTIELPRTRSVSLGTTVIIPAR